MAGLTAVRSFTAGQVEICQLMVDISASSAMSFAASVVDPEEGKYEPCDLATKLANLVVPKIKG